MIKLLNRNFLNIEEAHKTSKDGNSYDEITIYPRFKTGDTRIPPLTKFYTSSTDLIEICGNTVLTGTLIKNQKGYNTVITKITDNNETDQNILIAAIPFNGTLTSVVVPDGMSIRKAQVTMIDPVNFDSDKFKVSRVMGLIIRFDGDFPKSFEINYCTSTLAPTKDNDPDKCTLIDRMHTATVTMAEDGCYGMESAMQYKSTVINSNEKPAKIPFSEIFPMVYDADKSNEKPLTYKKNTNKSNDRNDRSSNSERVVYQTKNFSNNPFKDLVIPEYAGNERKKDSRRRNKKGGKRR